MLIPCYGAGTPYVSKTDHFVSAVARALPTGCRHCFSGSHLDCLECTTASGVSFCVFFPLESKTLWFVWVSHLQGAFILNWIHFTSRQHFILQRATLESKPRGFKPASLLTKQSSKTRNTYYQRITLQNTCLNYNSYSSQS